MSNEDWRNHHDEDGFPIANEDRKFDTFTDEYGVTYVCEFIEGLGWSWRNIGKQSDES